MSTVPTPVTPSPAADTTSPAEASASPSQRRATNGASNPGGSSRHHGHHKSSTSSGSHSSTIVGSHYKIGKKIGEGSFGIIYEGVSLLNETLVAIKFEPRKTDAPQLRDEYRTYKLLAGSVGIPNVYFFGQEGLHNILVIDLLGHSMEDLFDCCNRKFSFKCTAMVAKQMITRVQTIHEKNLIYRDIKPDNFLIGRGANKQNMVYMVDFGMAKQYRDPKTKQHIPYRERKSLSGTARYMSINTHLGREQSRRDDLEALGHVFMYFLRGSLPWQGMKAATNKQKYEKIGEKKQQTSIKELCDGYPEEFAIYLTYARKLGFEENPDYDYMRGLMNKVLQRVNETDDGVYDWMLLDKDKLKPKGDGDIHSSNRHPNGNLQVANNSHAQLVNSSTEVYRGSHRVIDGEKSQNLTVQAIRNASASGSRMMQSSPTTNTLPQQTMTESKPAATSLAVPSTSEPPRRASAAERREQQGGLKAW